MPLSTGTRLGPYEILAHIGAGGMGEVYRARDTRLGREVAVKVVSTEFGARFQTEARAIAALNHPNICTLHDVGPNYLVMEFVEGETLAARLTNGPLATAEAIRFGVAVADALAAAHDKSMAHRDLKPGNVMITPEGRVKLLDFGLAKMLDQSDPNATRTVDGAVMGTFAYMSPEQLQGKPAGASSDIFTFGALLYEMLTGRRAFDTGALRADSPTVTGVSPDLAAIVTRCLRRDPEDRYDRMADVKEALQRATAAPAEAAPSIAVLPFANMSGDKENEYFSDGLAEEILNALTRVEGLKVTARTSAFAFRGKDQDIRKIGEALSVRTVLEGSVRRAGNRIRVTAQLISIADGYHLWSERYDRDMNDVFAVQDEISAAIVDALKVKLASDKPKPRPVNLEAYHALLKGRYLQWKGNPADTGRSLAEFEAAIALDPNYAPAHAALGMAFFAIAQIGAKPVREMMPRARAAARRALELDETLADAHAVLAVVAATFDYDWKEALTHLQYARAANDSSLSAMCCALVLAPLGRFEEIIGVTERAIAADPLAPAPHNMLAAALASVGSYERAKMELLQLIELHRNHFAAYLTLGIVYLAQGLTQDAIAVWEKGMAAAPWFPAFSAFLAGAYRRVGEHGRSEALLARVTSMGEHGIVESSLGAYYLTCDDFDRAADHFERAIEARHFAVSQILFGPLGKEFRETPQGRALLAKMNLTDVSGVGA